MKSMKSISKHQTRWRSALVALAVAAALSACSKSQADKPAAGPADQAAVQAPAARPGAPVKPHGSHDAAHGGVVMMDAEHHVEIVLDARTGAHRVYVSDGARDPLPASTFDAVQLTVAGESLAMRPAGDDQAWEATGKPTPTSGATVSIVYSKAGKQVGKFDDLPIEYVLTGAMAGAEAQGHDHAAGGGEHAHAGAGEQAHAGAGEHAHQAPHGGLIKTTTGGHIELLADASGKFQVWLLDGDLAPRPAAGAQVKIKVAAKGYPDVVASAKDDHFEGGGSAIPGEHPAAIVTAVVGGKAETARFELHLEAAAPADGHQHGH